MFTPNPRGTTCVGCVADHGNSFPALTTPGATTNPAGAVEVVVIGVVVVVGAVDAGKVAVGEAEGSAAGATPDCANTPARIATPINAAAIIQDRMTTPFSTDSITWLYG